MIAELEIYRAAKILLKEYGAKEAGLMGAKSTISMIELGDVEGCGRGRLSYARCST
jgi:hypothetical protein